MIRLDQIQSFFPPQVRDNPAHQKHILKEYIQLMILDYLSSTSYARKIVFIGGTNLRLIKGIDRFSEDLDFDCKSFTEDEFNEMTDSVLLYLERQGLRLETKENINKSLQAFRKNIFFPELLFELGLSGHREERFLIKIECQDQEVPYATQKVNIKGCGFYFPFPVPSDGVLTAMKLSALISRQKGRDFYDAMFLLGQSGPDWAFLTARWGIGDAASLHKALHDLLQKIDLDHKARDFDHLVFEKRHSTRILMFKEFIDTLPLFSSLNGEL
ncbi:MAG TPA: nucleotidyl transferase AbiEii/AbiGii toxin family protein [Bacteroidales bacterium]|nr:nucleotidyl transferase AbiEii/AbiGii toxin family protein [Bacteroidales bacterium]HPI85914.1 nucleotidyl transferase AbiEii/AbiGii toxin family protein [Bacteroidales bacterium]HPM91257.1 nucleotidyl transferase AbiEii/AbiGii toxin family protein [Bacteroidales bacterium]